MLVRTWYDTKVWTKDQTISPLLSTTGAFRLAADISNIENIIGSAYADDIAGNAQNNLINGGAGNDNIDGNLGSDTLIGGLGNDTFIFASIGINNADTVTDFASGIDKIQLSVSTFSALSSGIYTDMFLSANGAIVAQDSNDYLIYNSLTGDLFYDADAIGAGAQQLIANFLPNTNLLQSDFIGALNIFQLNPLQGLTLIGTPLADLLTGTSKNDRIDGLASNDTIIGGLGNDSMDGGDGSDIYIISSAAEHIMGEIADNGTIGADEVRFTTTAPDTLTLFQDEVGIESVVIGTGNGSTADTSGIANININAQSYSNGLTIAGNNGNNNIFGTSSNDTLIGGAGNDTLIGSSGADSIMGGIGDDTLDGGAGIDSLVGGNGNDSYYIDNLTDAVVENLNEGIDTVFLSVQYSGNLTLGYTLGSNIENLTFNTGIYTAGAQLKAVGNSLDNVIIGDGNLNILFGGDGNDTLDGGTGQVAQGGSSVDYLFGGTGNDSMNGGDGDDFYYFTGSSEHQVAEINDTSGLNAVLFNSIIDNDTFTIFSGEQGIDSIIFGNLGTRVNGDIEFNVLSLNAINLNADASNASNKLEINGNNGNNSLKGSAFNDIILGNDGNDTILGNSGNDILTGGIGVDTFKWNLADKGTLGNISNATDKITDFSVAQNDVLDLRDLLVGENSTNILNYIDVSYVVDQNGADSTELRISSTGQFTGGNYSAGVEDAHITLDRVNLFALTGSATEAVLLQNLITNNKLIIDLV